MKKTIQLDDRELATVLAGLRLFQITQKIGGTGVLPMGIAEIFEDTDGPLTNEAIDVLCEEINFSEPLRVLIEVNGGVVDPVHLSHDGHVTVYDHDNIEAGDEPPCDLEKETAELPYTH